MNSVVIVFPGSNCDRDLAVALQAVSGRAPAMVWHGETALPDKLDIIAVPGGFSYGDYLRSGAMAARSPGMRAGARAGARGIGAAIWPAAMPRARPRTATPFSPAAMTLANWSVSPSPIMTATTRRTRPRSTGLAGRGGPPLPSA